ncbi:endonuclease domain-containing protein [Actinoplanes palleronii]|uniref:DUF559 domain-containing protein n=1 Tax=Actinoplanes palleronii TaxID=113570 RepID=A0ABQ4BFH8_9ACTN|nr:hypothetical protein [Actinoplanes palleronii]GIE69407.1 hypothetical protein Apa02nite_055150 [Actinoplanes palleronii]
MLPGSDDDEFARTCFEQAGVLTVAQAVRFLGRGIARGHVNAGRWRQVCRGIVTTTNGELLRRQQLWAALLLAGRGAALAGVTALAEAGVRGLWDPGVRVLVPAERNRTLRLPGLPPDMPPVRITRTRLLPDEHRQAGSPPRTIVARSVVDAAVWAPTWDAARTVIAASCQQRRVTPAEIFAVLATRRRLPRFALIKATLNDVAGGAEALSEIDFMELCRRFGFPMPDRQERRRDRSGRIRFLDAYWKRWRLHVEIDGSHHIDAGHWESDMLRQNQVWIDGDRILRFPAAMIRSRPEAVAVQLRQALEAAGWRR